MTRSILIFLGCFAGGALLALVVRATRFNPHDEATPHVDHGGSYSAMVSNPLTPPKSSSSSNPAPATSGHDHRSTRAETQSDSLADRSTPVNTICAICGMPVDPSLPTAEYEGKTIGFGCRMCPPKFKAQPDKYGPAYIRNELYQP